MKRFVLLFLVLFDLSILNSCESVRFNQMLSKYFLSFFKEDGTVRPIDDFWDMPSWYYDLTKDSLYKFAIKYCPIEGGMGSSWVANSYFSYTKNRLLWFSDFVETDTSSYSDHRFVLCDLCGNILDSVCMRESNNESFRFFADQTSLIQLHFRYNGLQKQDTVKCTKKIYKIEGLKIKLSKDSQEYRLTGADFFNDWQGWK